MTMTSSGQQPKSPVNLPQAVAATPQVVPATDTIKDLAQTIVDTGQTVEQAVAPRPDPRDPWGGIEAKPMHAPAFDQIRKKNQNIEIRWVNRFVNGATAPLMRYEQMLAMGWVPVKVNIDAKTGEASSPDVFIPIGCAIKDGCIQNYDVILMKIDRARYIGAMRYNNERVNKAVQRPGVIAGANENLKQDLAREGALGKSRGKVSTFIPGERDFK